MKQNIPIQCNRQSEGEKPCVYVDIKSPECRKGIPIKRGSAVCVPCLHDYLKKAGECYR